MKHKQAVQCKRCGICCKKGGPSLHEEDRDLVDSGRIPARSLFTLRKGELARDNVRGRLTPLPAEILKIKGTTAGWTCLFFDEPSKGCGIYKYRPLECRALNCRDTRKLEAMYDRSRLTREDLLGKVNGLWELIADHERRCSYEKVKRLIDEGSVRGVLKREAEILEIMRYDIHLRRLTMDRAGVGEGILDFLFGRPLSETIKMYDLDVIQKDGLYRLASRS
jgi:Fe-S-cluster containining protein